MGKLVELTVHTFPRGLTQSCGTGLDYYVSLAPLTRDYELLTWMYGRGDEAQVRAVLDRQLKPTRTRSTVVLVGHDASWYSTTLSWLFGTKVEKVKVVPLPEPHYLVVIRYRK